MSLQANLNQILHPHPTRRPDGQIITSPPLLEQLAEAVKPSGASRSGGSKGGHTPVNLDAIRKWKELDTYVRNEVQPSRGQTTRGTLGTIIETWETPSSPDDETYLTGVTEYLIDQITLLLDPPLPRRKIWQPCPACGEKTVPDEMGDRTAALTAAVWDDETGRVLHQTEMHLACSACGAEWAGDALKRTLESVANTWAEDLQHAHT